MKRNAKNKNTEMIFPCFEIESENILFLNEPQEYYEYLKKMFSGAKSRIIISSLYMGTGDLEKALVAEIEENLKRNESLSVKTLFDYSRGLRNKENSKTIFHECISQFPERFQLFLYHTPKLRGVLKRLLPSRVDEIIGVMHIKVYIADNDLLITGANLSNDYFVDRQDRYIVLKNCKHLCDFYSVLFDAIKSFSFKIDSNLDVLFENDNRSLHPYLGIYTEFCQEFAKSIDGIYEKYCRQSLSLDMTNFNIDQDEFGRNEEKAYIIPLVQNGVADVRFDEKFTNSFIAKTPADSMLHLATGYFNLTDKLIEIILKNSAQYKVLTTSALGNGFYGSKGFSKYIPDIYSCIEKSFYDKVLKSRQNSRVKLYEFYKENWTYHAKGLWFAKDGENKDSLPGLTIVGSSNFGRRSVDRDLEFQLAIYSRNEKFRNNLLNEQQYIYENSKQVTDKICLGRVPVWIRIASKFIKSYF